MKKAFTLAEILIVLSIVGVVAAMTIPLLQQNIQERATITALKKTYSTLNNAYKMAEQDQGDPTNWGLTIPISKSMMKILIPYLKISKDCSSVTKGCFPDVTYYMLHSSTPNFLKIDGWGSNVVLADGTLLAAGGGNESTTCAAVNGTGQQYSNVCGTFLVDVNGFKTPNRLGVDLFMFYLTKYGIVPAGGVQETAWAGFGSHCAGASDAGDGCTAWILYNDNMDYIKCPGTLSWSGPTKCN